MLRLVKYLKPFTLMILLAVALLFVQANADLALPDYMSKIVNVGIQRGGIESSVPEAIRKSQLDKALIFMSADEKAQVLGAYLVVDQNSADQPGYLSKYPALAKEPLYILKNIDQTTRDGLSLPMAKALLAVSGLEQAASNPQAAAAMLQKYNLTMPAGGDIFTALADLTPDQRTQLMTMFNQKFENMGESALIQAGASALKTEYTVLGMNVGQIETNYIVGVGLQMLLLTLLSVACAVGVGYLSARTAAGAARAMRRDVFHKVESFSSTEFDKFSTASLITRSTNDITQIQMVIIMMIRMVVYAPIMGVGGIIRAMNKDVSMWWIIALAVVILLGLIITIFSISLPKFKIMQKLIDRLNLVTRENLSGMMVIRAFNRQKFEEARFDKANQDLTGTNLFVSRVMVSMMPIMMLIMNGLTILIIWVGAQQVAQSNMQVGDMMAFMQYAIQIVFSFLMLSFMFIILPRASVSADRIAEVLYTKATILDPKEPKKFQEPFTGTVEFRNVSFRYPGAEENVLCGIDFIAQPGQTTAIIGSTGSGKSTVVNLIPRFYDVTEGAVLIDGMDIREVSQYDLRERIGYIPQQGTLFSGTIGSNLRYADENASSETVQDAIEISQAEEFIATRPEGLEAEIAQGGGNVSGGQKQRLSIARALVKKAPIYIFDDSFSALDFKTDAALRKALKQKTASSTILVVTQRISTIKHAEQIIVLDDGQIAGKGTHLELMQSCEPYREMALSQLSKEELA